MWWEVFGRKMWLFQDKSCVVVAWIGSVARALAAVIVAYSKDRSTVYSLRRWRPSW
jgi:hypothetical protein